VVSYPDGKTEQKELRDEKANALIGKKIGDIIEGSLLDIKGDLLITGGSDKDGFPMRKDIDGPIRKKILLSKSIGFKPKREGERRKKRVRGNMITDEIIQINTKLIEKPKKVKKKPEKKETEKKEITEKAEEIPEKKEIEEKEEIQEKKKEKPKKKVAKKKTTKAKVTKEKATKDSEKKEIKKEEKPKTKKTTKKKTVKKEE